MAAINHWPSLRLNLYPQGVPSATGRFAPFVGETVAYSPVKEDIAYQDTQMTLFGDAEPLSAESLSYADITKLRTTEWKKTAQIFCYRLPFPRSANGSYITTESPQRDLHGVIAPSDVITIHSGSGETAYSQDYQLLPNVIRAYPRFPDNVAYPNTVQKPLINDSTGVEAGTSIKTIFASLPDPLKKVFSGSLVTHLDAFNNPLFCRYTNNIVYGTMSKMEQKVLGTGDYLFWYTLTLRIGKRVSTGDSAENPSVVMWENEGGLSIDDIDAFNSLLKAGTFAEYFPFSAKSISITKDFITVNGFAPLNNYVLAAPGVVDHWTIRWDPSLSTDDWSIRLVNFTPAYEGVIRSYYSDAGFGARKSVDGKYLIYLTENYQFGGYLIPVMVVDATGAAQKVTQGFEEFTRGVNIFELLLDMGYFDEATYAAENPTARNYLSDHSDPSKLLWNTLTSAVDNFFLNLHNVYHKGSPGEYAAATFISRGAPPLCTHMGLTSEERRIVFYSAMDVILDGNLTDRSVAFSWAPRRIDGTELRLAAASRFALTSGTPHIPTFIGVEEWADHAFDSDMWLCNQHGAFTSTRLPTRPECVANSLVVQYSALPIFYSWEDDAGNHTQAKLGDWEYFWSQQLLVQGDWRKATGDTNYSVLGSGSDDVFLPSKEAMTLEYFFREYVNAGTSVGYTGGGASASASSNNGATGYQVNIGWLGNSSLAWELAYDEGVGPEEFSEEESYSDGGCGRKSFEDISTYPNYGFAIGSAQVGVSGGLSINVNRAVGTVTQPTASAEASSLGATASVSLVMEETASYDEMDGSHTTIYAGEDQKGVIDPGYTVITAPSPGCVWNGEAAPSHDDPNPNSTSTGGIGSPSASASTAAPQWTYGPPGGPADFEGDYAWAFGASYALASAGSDKTGEYFAIQGLTLRDATYHFDEDPGGGWEATDATRPYTSNPASRNLKEERLLIPETPVINFIDPLYRSGLFGPAFLGELYLPPPAFVCRSDNLGVLAANVTTLSSPRYHVGVMFIGEELPLCHGGGKVEKATNACGNVGFLTVEPSLTTGVTYKALAPGYDYVVMVDDYNKVPVALGIFIMPDKCLWAASDDVTTAEGRLAPYCTVPLSVTRPSYLYTTQAANPSFPRNFGSLSTIGGAFLNAVRKDSETAVWRGSKGFSTDGTFQSSVLSSAPSGVTADPKAVSFFKGTQVFAGKDATEWTLVHKCALAYVQSCTYTDKILKVVLSEMHAPILMKIWVSKGSTPASAALLVTEFPVAPRALVTQDFITYTLDLSTVTYDIPVGTKVRVAIYDGFTLFASYLSPEFTILSPNGSG